MVSINYLGQARNYHAIGLAVSINMICVWSIPTD